MKNEKVYVLLESYSDSDRDSVLGVFTAPFRAIKEMPEHYGFYTVVVFNDVRDSSIEWVQKIKTSVGLVTVTLQSYYLNEI